MTMRKVPTRRWMQGLNRAMPVVLDTAGIMLLSGSATTLAFGAGFIYGLATALGTSGLGSLVLSWRFYSSR